MGVFKESLLLEASMAVFILIVPAFSPFQSASIYANVNGKTNLSQIETPVQIEGVYRDSQFYIITFSR